MYSADLTSTRSRGKNYRYQYTYDNPTDVGPRQPMQLEFWIPKGRKGGRWVLSHDAPLMPGKYRAWRKVRPYHDHADKLAHSIGRVAPGGHWLSVEQQCDAYLAWARAKGLATVSVYASREATKKGWYGAKCAQSLGFQLRAVDPADIHGDAPEPEVCE